MISRRVFMFSLAGSVCTSAFKKAMADEKIDETLSVFIADTHISPKPAYKYTFNSLQGIVNEILEMKPLPARVVVLGDIAIGKGLIDDYKLARKVFKKLYSVGIKLHFTMGNHDHRKAFSKVFPEHSKNEIIKGRFVSVVNLGYQDLVLLDSLSENTAKEDSVNVANGAIDIDQMNFVKNTLAKYERPFICAAHHNPRDMSIEIDGEKCNVLQYLKENKNYLGWVQGHDHRWSRLFNFGNSKSRSATFPRLILPSSGYWGDIGYAIARSTPEKLEFSLQIRDFYYPAPMAKGERKPKIWIEEIEEKKGGKCSFFMP